MTHLQRLKDALRESGFDAVVVTSEINQRYLSCFPYTDGLIVVTCKGAYLLTDFRYIEAARASHAAEEFEILMPERRMSKVAYELMQADGVRTVALEEATIPLEVAESYKELFDGMTVVGGASKLIDTLREFKDAEEIEKMARAQDIADAAFAHILEFVRPGMTEQRVALELEFFMREHGAEAAAFETIAITGSATSRPHGVPRDIPIERGFFTMDFGARFDGYCSDMTRTVVLGRADDEMRRLYNTVYEAHMAALVAARPGMSCAAMDKIARDIIDSTEGYTGTFGHSLGHGVGMYIHEMPRLASRVPAEECLKVGQVVTIEPGIYLPRKYGCRIEDMIVITEDGYRDFAHSPKQLIEIDI